MDIDLCPPWWPHLLWRLHFPPVEVFPRERPINPVNLPPEMNRILLALVSYSSTFQLVDTKVAEELRGTAQKEIVAAANAIGRA